MLPRPDTTRRIVPSLLVIAALSPALAEEKGPATPGRFTHRVTGLFDPSRVAALREAARAMPEVELIAVDFENAEATFSYDPNVLSPQGRASEIIEQLDNRVRSATHHTFGVAPPSGTPRERLERVEIEALGLDCKGCCLGAYEAIYKLEGVEKATASFKDRLVIAWIDPAKTGREALKAALKARGVEFPEPSKP